MENSDENSNKREDAVFKEKESGLQAINLINLLDDPKELQEVKVKIDGQKGTMLTLIHPFFVGKNEFSSSDWVDVFTDLADSERKQIAKEKLTHLSADKDIVETKSLIAYVQKLQRFIQQNPEACIVLAEEKGRVGETREILEAIGFQGTLLFYETTPSDPEPDIGNQMILKNSLWNINKKINHETTYSIRDTKWQVLAHIFQEVGVKHILVGGQNSELNLVQNGSGIVQHKYEPTDEGVVSADQIHGKCVGVFIVKMLEATKYIQINEEFNKQKTVEDVTQTSLTYPDSIIK